MQDFGWKTWREETGWKTWTRWGNNVEMNLACVDFLSDPGSGHLASYWGRYKETSDFINGK
jgi:hypothetical protein